MIFKTWLLTIAWHKALDRRRSVGEWLRRFVSPSDDHGGPPVEPMSPGRSHEQRVIDDDLRRHLRRLVRTLPAHFRDVMLLIATGDHTFEEIATVLGVPLGTVKWRASEGRRLLKRKLAHLGFGDA